MKMGQVQSCCRGRPLQSDDAPKVAVCTSISDSQRASSLTSINDKRTLPLISCSERTYSSKFVSLLYFHYYSCTVTHIQYSMSTDMLY